MRTYLLIGFVGIIALSVCACGTKPAEGAPSETKSAAAVDLPMPPKAKVATPAATWGAPAPFDPLEIKNIDVPNADRQAYIEKLKAEIEVAALLEGVTITSQQVPALDANGNAVLDDEGNPVTHTKHVVEYWFEGHDHPYRAGQRVGDTDFIIPDGWDTNRLRKNARNPNIPPGYMPPYGAHNK
ncbi:MAG: hypothetical protein KDB29_15280 [Planctomycetes bacterium]|nr:hypothetical protein [Planctomycetota bacterium]